MQLLTLTQASEQTNRDEQFWREFVERFFAPDSSLRHVVKDLKADHSKQYEVLFPSLPRYFYVHYEGIDQMQIFIEQPSERGVNAPGATQPFYIVEALRAKFIYWFKNETQVRLLSYKTVSSSLLTFVACLFWQNLGNLH